MYFRRSTYAFSLLAISLTIYLFQYIDTENGKQAALATGTEKYNSSVRGLLFKSKSQQNAGQRRGRISEGQSDTCKQLHRPSMSDIRYGHTHWQVEKDEHEDIAVYSAFYDDRPIVGVLPWIRILGVRRLSRKPLWCHLWYSGNDNPFTVEADIIRTGKSYSVPGLNVYSQNMFSCPLDYADSIPTHVSIATQHCATSSIFLPIITPRKSDDLSHNFGACLYVKSENVRPELMVEWMEANAMFGLTRVNVYNSSYDSQLDRVFDYYRKKGFVELLEMPPAVELFSGSSNNGVTFGRSIALNDCMMRNIYFYRFIIIADLDEIIVPRLHSNYREMFDHLDHFSRRQNSHNAYSFRTSYFFQHLSEDKWGFLRTMRLQYRARWSEFLVGSKSFIDPRRCKSIFNLYCLAGSSDQQDFLTVDVNTSIALNHRYRSNCPFSHLRCQQLKREKVRDNVMLKYKDVLLRRVASALNTIGVRSV